MKFQCTHVAAALRFGGIALLVAGPSSAQDIRVNVTGTNIKRVDTETAAPIETITREAIQASGFQTISEVVRSITANNNSSLANEWSFGFPSGGSGVSLRGLGSNNTLVLLNGRRLANYATATAGTSYKGDGNQYRGAVTYGMGDLTKDRYNFFVTVDAQKQEEMPHRASPTPARCATSGRWTTSSRASSPIA